MKLALVTGAIAIGFLLLVGSSVSSRLFPATSTWTEEKASRSADVKARLAYLGGVVNSRAPRMHGGLDPVSAKAEFDALKTENEQLNAEFQTAHDRPNTIAWMLKWSGIGVLAVGVVGWFAVKNTS
jgi:hypothetical protein